MKRAFERVILPAAFVVAVLAIVSWEADEVAAAATPDELAAGGWELAWSDEFEADKLDDTKWERCKRGTPDWKNTMSDDGRLLEIEDGVLRSVARRGR